MMKLVKILSATGLLTAGIMGVSTAQAQQEAAPAGPMCTVTVERNQSNGVFDVTRQVFEDGSCNCYVYTGSDSQADQVEARVSDIQRTQRCPGAQSMAVAGRGPGSGASAGAGAAGARDEVVAGAAFAVAGAGIIFAIEESEEDPELPVSP